MSRCALVDVTGLKLTVRGLGRHRRHPILDIKPYTTKFQSKTGVREPAWGPELMADCY
jgi:tRNA (Thr-GGU) A37 N-methylase